MRNSSSLSRFSAYRTVREGREVSRMRSFCVSCSPFSSTLYTSFADGGRCPIFLILLFSFVFTTKTIPHSGSPQYHVSSQLLSISPLRTLRANKPYTGFFCLFYVTANSRKTRKNVGLGSCRNTTGNAHSGLPPMALKSRHFSPRVLVHPDPRNPAGMRI
jgi:hypothetical protein